MIGELRSCLLCSVTKNQKKLKNERERRSETTNQSLKKKEKKKKKMGGNYWVFKIRDVPNIP